ncbi:MAG TPA: cupin domain-containing protein [Nitrososphaera sp.]|nr:cupin domain-containing protein [Nitrososphaera sp.]
MANPQTKNLNSPDETRSFEKGKMQISTIGEVTMGRFVFEPGWQWSKSVKPVVKTDSCQQQHTGYIISGRMKVRMDDGTESEAGPGDFTVIPPGHDAWVVGDEQCIGIDFTGAKTYAK